MRRLRSGIAVRATLGRAVLAALLVAIFLVVVGVAEKGGGQTTGRPDHTARLVPTDALLYVHGDVDRGSSQWSYATALGKRLRFLAQLRERLLGNLTKGRAQVDPEREIYPWLGKEAAIAFMPDRGGTARSLILLEVADRDLAESFLARVVGPERTVVYDGTGIRIHGALATAFLGNFLAIGRLQNVRAAIDVRAHRLKSLDATPAFLRARAKLPGGARLLYAYASPRGLRQVIEPRPGLIGWLGRLMDERRLEAAAASLLAEKHGLRVHFASVSSEGGTDASKGGGPSAGAAEGRPYHPVLQAIVPSRAAAYIDTQGAARLLSGARQLGQASLPFPAELLRPLRSALATGGGALTAALGSLLQRETALVVTRSRDIPVLSLVITGVDETEATSLLLRVQPLLTKLLAKQPVFGAIPTFEPRQIAGLDAATLRLTPALQLTFAVYAGRLIISTRPEGVRAFATSHQPIGRNPTFVSGTEGRPPTVTSLIFLDLRQLLALGENAGLGRSAEFQVFKADLSNVKALSAVTSSEKTSRSAEIFVQVQ
jgi:hypothetical protein